MNYKNDTKTTATDFIEQLDGSGLDLLSIPIVSLEREANIQKKSSNLTADGKTPTRTPPKAKERITVQINKGTIERLKDCVYWNRLTVAKFVEEALEAALQAAETNNGSPFQKRRSELKPGRPVK